ncbi:MAG: ribosome assembly cofactor RimP [Mariprofundaceae bacterium]|nr:ribosome assembly cofactor RimP [Mariprofundaceae bacterium]
MSLESKILELLTPVTDELGVDVLRIRVGGPGSSQLVQVLVDRKGGVDSDTLARVSRGLALQLDVEDLIPGKYRLELSSPGFEWPLETAADFDRYEGEWIRVTFEEGEPVEGDNLGPEGDGFRIQERGREPRHFVLSEVKKVVRAVDWKRVSRGKKR